MSRVLRDPRNNNLLATVTICLAIFPVLACAETDPRAELQKVIRAEQQLSADRQEYIQSTQEQLDDIYGQLVDTGLGLPGNYVGKSLRQAFDAVNSARKIMASDDPAQVRVGKMLLDQVYKGAVDNLLGAVGKEFGSDLLKQVPGLALKQAFRLAPSLVDWVFNFLKMEQDKKQLDDLDRRQQDLDKLREYWTRKMRGEQAGDPPQGDRQNSQPASQSTLNNAGIRVMTPPEAVRTGQAGISGTATSGYSQADVHIVSRTDDWLALNFNEGYLIPGNSTSGSQRLGLVSVVQRTAYELRRPRQSQSPMLPVLFQLTPNGETGSSAYSNGNWVLVSPRAHVVVPFHSVCLDHSRGTPLRSEGFYAAEQPLPGRLQRILFSASLNGVVPQSSVWSTIEREGISWYDPRNDFGSVEIQFIGDNSTRRFRLGSTIWIDGQVVMEKGPVGIQAVSFRVPSGKHTLELMPLSLEGLQPNPERTRTEVEVRYGEVTRFVATVHVSVVLLGSKIGISSFKEIAGPSQR